MSHRWPNVRQHKCVCSDDESRVFFCAKKTHAGALLLNLVVSYLRSPTINPYEGVVLVLTPHLSLSMLFR